MKDMTSFCINLIGRIGDAVLATAMLRHLGAHYPDAVFDIIASPGNAAIFRGIPKVRTVFLWRRGLLHLPGNLLTLAIRRYDCFIDSKDHHSSTSRLIAHIVRANRSIGFNTPNRRKLFTDSIPHTSENAALHMTLRNCRILEPLGIPLPDIDSSLPWLPQFNPTTTDSYGDQSPILLNLSAGGSLRIPGVDQWIAVCEQLKYAGLPAVISCMDPEKPIAALLEKRFSIPVRHSSTLAELFAIIAGSRAVISPDTSVVHLAAATNRPVIGLYPAIGWNLVAYAPLSSWHRVLVAPTGEPVSRISCDALERECVALATFLKE